MIMSYLANLEMSSFGRANMPFSEGGHDGRRGHSDGTSGRVEAVARDPEGSRGDHQSGRAAEILSLSGRQIRRIVRRIRKEGHRG